MTREGNVPFTPVRDGSVNASPRPLESCDADGDVPTYSVNTDDDDGDESDGDFELETMEDDDDDDDDDDEEEEDEAEEALNDGEGEDPVEDGEGEGEESGSMRMEDVDVMDDVVVGDEELREELMALAAGADEQVVTADADTIAHRTRTKFSLVDVEIDSLESLLPPDTFERVLLDGENEYQRFLASLLPTGGEDDNLSFLDEEDEEYRPDDDDDEEEEEREQNDRRRRAETEESEDGPRGREDDEDDDDDDDDDYGGANYDDEGQERQALRVSKRELTELLWDSTQIKIPPTFSRANTSEGQATTPGTATATSRDTTLPNAVQSAENERAVAPPSESGNEATAAKDLRGTVSPQQCLQLASQMHKHFQLLLQTYHMIANVQDKKSDPKESECGAETDAQASSKTPVNKDQLEECAAMLQELQIRGKHALEHKAKVLSKLTASSRGSSKTTNNEELSERRVTRSISAAYAAVAHPSMFDIVGSQSMGELTQAFERGCSLSERNQKLQKNLLELDKHILHNRRKRKSGAYRKTVFLGAEDRLLLQGVKRHGLEADAWPVIRETLLPTKDEAVLSKRYRYLTSKKKRSGGYEFKEFNSELNSRKKGVWMIEEDVRVARGAVEYFGDNRRFARISLKFLPHRHRLEIRKRWERLKEQYRSQDGTVKYVDERLVTNEKSSRRSTVRAEDTDPSMMMTSEKLALRAAAKEFTIAVRQFLEAKLRRKLIEIPAAAATETAKAAGKKRATLLANSSKAGTRGPTNNPPAQVHHQPSSCDDKNLHPALFFSSWAVIHPASLLERTCEHNWPAFIGDKHRGNSSASTLDLVSRAAASRVEEEAASHRVDLTSGCEQLEPIQEDRDEDEENLASSGLDLSFDTVDSGNDDDHVDDEESDFEQEELLSSDAEESDSEYEQMELSDNEDDGEHESFDEMDLSHDEEKTHLAEEDKPAQVKHTLRLENLRQPGDTRAIRALEALERRIAGDKPSEDQTTGFTPLQLDSSRFELLPPNEAPFNEADLLAYEELNDSPPSEGDDGFEQDELHSSSDEEIVAEESEESMISDRTKRASELVGAQPLKRAKLLEVAARCGACDSSPCVCTSARMQRLMARMRPSGISEDVTSET